VKMREGRLAGSLRSAAMPIRIGLSNAVSVRASALRSAAFPVDADHPKEAHADDSEWFSAWFFDPRFQTQAKGFRNVRLGVRPGGLTILPTTIETLVHGWRDPIEYDWPVVVMEQLLPFFPSGGLLVDVRGEPGLCVARPARQVRDALSRAGLVAVSIRRWGWISPRRIRPAELGEHIESVPQSIVRRS